MASYTIINLTAGAAAVKSHIEWTAPATGRVLLRGVIVGNNAATGAQGVEWCIDRLSATGTGTAITPEKRDPDSGAAAFTAKSTMTANGTKTGNSQCEFGFDIVGTYVLWFPPGLELIATSSDISDIRKTIGADTSAWSITAFYTE
jgi:hypothetical protein